MDKVLIALWVFSVLVSVVFGTALPVLVVSVGLVLGAAVFGRRHARWD